MRIRFCHAICLGALFIAGCAQDQENYSPGITAAPVSSVNTTNAVADSQLIVTQAEGLNGKVSSVNANLRFVVLSFSMAQMPTVNQQLSVYRNGLKVGIVNVTGPQRDDSTVADIVMGEAQAGDDVRDR